MLCYIMKKAKCLCKKITDFFYFKLTLWRVMKNNKYKRKQNLKKLARKNKLNLFEKEETTFILILKSDLDKRSCFYS